ncbi:hypothetical protein EIN_418530 [Entamoeba invadens IP1]|uniref:ubiquitinyl hydrolase 1 n=1 Tax=Entamoeba invadens IP1 TaxID=370355 RepID=A0A0A1U1S5_ENTIV|nr:hypothetical protein EIN_418530 [Entamoeba invadens IP1]ELP87974.1 hypothetical protein EIN_418530 [Entamoeba invadens IP1]|eukprot:XP_004254745.1 hypothetical protein EIN_418530 [Entamoeba invadens IP1]
MGESAASMDIDDQIQLQLNEFLPRRLHFVLTETLNPLARTSVLIDNKIDVSHDEVFALMKWPKLERNVGKGYFNAHSNCYMISVLQALTHTTPLYNYIAQSKVIPSLEDPFWTALASLFSKAFVGKQNTILKPIAFEKNLKILSKSLERYEQEDATEFYVLLLDHLHEAAIGKGKNKISIISSIFHTTLTSRITCYNCLGISDSNEQFSFLPVEVTKDKTLESGLDVFFKKDVLDGYTCDKCKTSSKASKRYFVKELPWVLAIQIKRFGWDERKINGFVKFPSELNMSKYGKDGLFDLYGVIVHLGRTKHGGHYICYIKGPNSGWFQCDDDTVTSVPIKTVLKSEGYMLFYKRSNETVLKSDTNKVEKQKDDIDALSALMKMANDKETSVKQQNATKQEQVTINEMEEIQERHTTRVHTLIVQLKPILSKVEPIKRKPESIAPPLEKKRGNESLDTNAIEKISNSTYDGFTIKKKSLPKEEKQEKSEKNTKKVVKRKKHIDAFDLKTIPVGLQFNERVDAWDDDTNTQRKELRGVVGDVDKEIQSRVTKLDQYDIDLDKPKQRKLRKNMKNAFRVSKGVNAFQKVAEQKKKSAKKHKKDF